MTSENQIQGRLFELPPKEEKPDVRPIDDATRDQLLASLLGLLSIRGIGEKTVIAWFRRGLIFEIWDTDTNNLEKLWLNTIDRPRHDVIEKVVGEKAKLLDHGWNLAKDLGDKGIVFVPRGHHDYPASLGRLEEPPDWLFVMGDLDCLNAAAIVTIVGTRKASEEGKSVAYQLAKSFSERNAVVLSGLAKGIDEEAHLGAVDQYGQTIAVLGHGIKDRHFSANRFLVPRIIETGGAVVSEYFTETPPSRERYLRRNELQAAFSKALLPVEVPSLASGTGATIRRAQRLKVPVIGVVRRKTAVPSILATIRNLREVKVPILEFQDGDCPELWDKLRELAPTHDWDVDPQPRQDRFFESIVRSFEKNSGRLNLRTGDINRLIERLKDRLRL